LVELCEFRADLDRECFHGLNKLVQILVIIIVLCVLEAEHLSSLNLTSQYLAKPKPFFCILEKLANEFGVQSSLFKDNTVLKFEGLIKYHWFMGKVP
jgi:hypothetical protein